MLRDATLRWTWRGEHWMHTYGPTDLPTSHTKNEMTGQAGDMPIRQLQREDALKPQDMGSFVLETCYH